MNDVHSLEQFGNLALSFVIGFYFHVWFGVRLFGGSGHTGVCVSRAEIRVTQTAARSQAQAPSPPCHHAAVCRHRCVRDCALRVGAHSESDTRLTAHR